MTIVSCGSHCELLFNGFFLGRNGAVIDRLLLALFLRHSGTTVDRVGLVGLAGRQ
jgi:hypothetical protein